jgi:uncharacterized protein (DUF58 family)
MKWFAGIVLILLLALLLEAGLLAYAMYVLLGLLVVSRFLAREWIGRLSAEREFHRLTAEIGDTVAVNLTVRNHGWLPVPWVLLEDLLPSIKGQSRGIRRLRVKGKRIQICTLRPAGQITLRYKLEMHMRGYYQVGPLLLESGDLFGLHRRYRVETEPEYLLVYPRVVPLQGYDLSSRRPIGEVRMTHRLYEDPTRISGVREYQNGDPLNRVHWRATARTGELHCKVYEPSTIAGVTILLDFHQAGYHAQGEPHRSELAITTAASLAGAVYQMGQQVGFITNGRDAAERIRVEGWERDYRTRQKARRSSALHEKNDRLQPLVIETRRGVEQFQRIREVLARVELTDGLSFAQLVIEAASRLPRDATVAALLPDVPVETALALGNLRRRGFAITAVLLMLGDDHALAQCHGRLVAEGIRDVRHLKSEAELPWLCQRQVMNASPYEFAMINDE